MPKFFCGEISPGQNILTISGKDAVHISGSLRMSVSDNLTVCDGNGTDYICKITNISPESITLEILESLANSSEPSVSVSVFFAMPKGDKAEFIIQKSVELGASSITPFISEHCVSRPSPDSFEKKRIRYQKIAEEAAKQCGRGVVPKIFPIIPFKQAVLNASKDNLPLILYEAEHNCSLKNMLEQDYAGSVSFISGPEGGFSPDEIEFAAANSVKSVTLGKRILRCETAPIAALCAIMYQSGNLG